jgi:septal ring factor EnvC (AmiA/AmiB activator)
VSNEQVLFLVALITALAGLWTARSTSRSSSAGTWGLLVAALEERVDGMADEITELRAGLERDQETIARQQETIALQDRRITTLENELRRLGVNPDEITGHPV